MPTLYDLSNELMSILDNEELTTEDEALLASLEMKLDAKVEAVLQFRQSLVADAAAIKSERERLKAREDAMNRRAEWLKTYVLETMQRTGVTKIATVTFTASVAKSPLSVRVEDGAELPAQFMRRKVTVEVDKKAILDQFEHGGTLPAGVTVTQGSHLRIS